MATEDFSTTVPPSSMGGANTSTSSKISEAASQLKNKAADLGRSAGAQIDSSRSAAAGGIASAAASLHQHAEDLPGGDRVTGFAHSAANKLSSTADYLRANDMDAMVEDIKALLKNNPGPALLGAAVIGFLLGKSFSNRD